MAIDTAEELFSPLTVDAFIDRYLEQEVLFLERDAETMVSGQFDLESLGQCIRTVRPWHRKVLRVIPSDGGREETSLLNAYAEAVADSEAEAFCLDAFTSQKTLVLCGAEEYWPSVTKLVTNLRATLASFVRCNVYCTPPESQGFGTHVDGHDTLILQTYGSKTWSIYEVDQPLPLQSASVREELVPRLKSNQPKYSIPTREMVLQPGNVLYLPAGVPHSARSSKDASIHFTIGLYPLRWHAFIGQLVNMLAQQEIDLRRRIPAGTMRGEEFLPSAGDLLRELAKTADRLENPIDLNDLVRINVESYAYAGDVEGALDSVLNAEKINLNTVVSRPGGCRFTWRVSNGEIRARCGLPMSLPLKLECVMSFLEEQVSFRVGDLPDEITEEAKVVLVRNLVRRRLLRIHSIGEKPPMTVRELEAAFGFDGAPMV